MNAEIFIPMYYMVLLTASVFLLSTLIRFKNVLVDKSHTGSELMKIPLPASAAQITKQADRNLINLFEFPILFYAICVVLYVTGKVDAYFVVLAYWFVGLRVAHSLYHIFINGFIGDMPLRALLWLPSWLIVIWMWVRFASLI
ncbi:MAPEG family protein [Gammaproteobacteria bacterium]|nr:MAPEG family protein [Gammaproteobacteria bacterium]MDC3018161.1 MAPEG family protein [Gammaproteobacteria bacterium]MDC3027248.1 MAPEG family protein [Gammaproteobacteria bacterium]MDC3045806.1 MAPEG family protein [Gammaproteobacteria bacterium]|tara:strand:- start:345 stop:773 length:429 start_codon:yes stop_codon:yes gene_type:complete